MRIKYENISSYIIVFHFVVSVLLVFIAVTLVDIIRRLIFEKMDSFFGFSYKNENMGRKWQ